MILSALLHGAPSSSSAGSLPSADSFHGALTPENLAHVATTVAPLAERGLSLNLNYWILQTIAMMVTALLIPKLRITSLFGALGTVIALSFVNAHVWDAALFFKIPNALTSQAAVLFVANGVVFWILVKILPGIEVEGFLPALVAPVVFTIASVLIETYASHVDWIEVGKMLLELARAVRDSLLTFIESNRESSGAGTARTSLLFAHYLSP